MSAHFTPRTWAENLFSFPQCSGDCSSLCPQDRPNLLWTMEGKCQLRSSVVSPMIPTRPLSKGAGGRAGREVKEGFLEEGKRAEQEGDTARWALTRHKQLGILGASSPGQAVPRGPGVRLPTLPCPRRGAGNLLAEHLCPVAAGSAQSPAFLLGGSSFRTLLGLFPWQKLTKTRPVALPLQLVSRSHVLLPSSL